MAHALADKACHQGFGVFFVSVSTHTLLQHVRGWARRRHPLPLPSRIRRPNLSVQDDFGLCSLPPGPEDLYDIIDGRYESGSLLLISNRAPAKWSNFSGDPLLTNSGRDRFLQIVPCWQRAA